MNFKKYLLMLSLLLILCVSLGTVSATDVSVSDINEESTLGVDNVDIGYSDVAISDENNDSINLKASQSFGDIQSKIDNATSGDTIELDGIYYGEGSEITIDKSLTINGNGATLDAKGLSRIFNISSDDVKLINLNLVNGLVYGEYIEYSYEWYDEDSGEYYTDYWSGVKAYGGAVFGYGNNTYINNCNFTNCSVGCDEEFIYECDIRGGSLYIVGDNFVVNNSNFVNYFAPRGSAIYLEGNNGSISNSKFENNTAYLYEFGSEEIIYASSSRLDITNCSFKYNTASTIINLFSIKNNDGEYEGNLFVDNCTFESNFNLKDYDLDFMYADNISVTNSYFTNNNGGTIYADSNLNMSYNYFINNNGGTIYAVSNLNMSYNYFINNTCAVGDSNNVSMFYCIGDNLSVSGNNVIMFYCIGDNLSVSGNNVLVEYSLLNSVVVRDLEIYEWNEEEDTESYIIVPGTFKANSNYWGNNFYSKDEFINNEIITIVKIIEEMGELEYSYVAPDSWINAVLSDLEPVNVNTNTNITINFNYLNDGSKLDGYLPNFTLSWATKLVKTNGYFNISNGIGSFVYSPKIPGNDKIIISSTNDIISKDIKVTGSVEGKLDFNEIVSYKDVTKVSLTLTTKDGIAGAYTNLTIRLPSSTGSYEDYYVTTDENGKATFYFKLNPGSWKIEVISKDFKVDESKTITVTTKSGNRTFTDLMYPININTNVINLEHDYVFDKVLDAELVNGVPITRNLIINGNGHIIDGKNLSAMFNINGDISVTFNNIVFKNGFSNSSGVIYADCDGITFNNCSFLNNYLIAYAIYKEYRDDEEYIIYENSGILNIKSDKLVINKCIFEGNYGKLMDGYNIVGEKDIIYILYVSTNDGFITIDNCIFRNNDINAINIYENISDYWEEYNKTHTSLYDDNEYIKDYINYIKSGKIIIKNSEFTNNLRAINVDGDSGIMGYATYVVVENCSFIESMGSEIKEGSIISSHFLILTNSSFINNNRHAYYIHASGPMGGVVYAYRYMEVSSCSFINNTIDGGFGTLFSYSDRFKSIVKNSTFINNKGSHGGAIGGYGDWDISNSYFLNNSAIGYKGTFYDEYGEFHIDISGDGGVIYGGVINANNCSFINSSASGNGGAIYGGVINANNCSFINNSASGNGGAIYSNMDYEETYENHLVGYIAGNISNCIFDNNKADNKSNIIYLYMKYYEHTYYYDDIDEYVTTTIEIKENYCFDNNFWGNNYKSIDEFKSSDLIGFYLCKKFHHNYYDDEVEDWIDVYGVEFINYTNLAPNKWVVLDILVPSFDSKVVEFNLTLNTLNDGSKLEGSLPDYVVNVESDVGGIDNNSVVISNGVGSFNYFINSTHDIVTVYANDGSVITSKEINISELPISKLPSSMDISQFGNSYGDKYIIISLSEAINNQEIILKFSNGMNYTVTTNASGVARFDIPFVPGNYSVEASATNDIYLIESTCLKGITINKFIPNIIISNIDDIVYGEVLKVSASVTGVGGKVIGTAVVKVYDKSGVDVTSKLSKLSVGTYTVVASYAGNENYTANNASKVFTVNKYASSVKVSVPESVDYGKTVAVSVSVPKDATGSVTLTIDGKTYTSSVVKNGVATFNIVNLSVGNHNLKVSYGGDLNYNGSSASATLKVNKAISSVVVSVNDIVYGEVPKVSASVTGVDGKVIGTASVKVYDKSGVDVTSKLSKLSAGTYTVVASYAGNENYTSNNASKMFTVNKVKATLTLSKSGSYYNATTLTVKLVNSATGKALANEKITLKIGSKTVAVTTNADGIATYLIPYAPATYAVTASVSNEIIESNVAKLSVKISKVTATISASSLTTTYNSGKYFQVKVLAKDKKPIVGLKLTLKVYTGSKYKTVSLTTDANGVAKYSGSTLSIAKHKVVVSSAESTKYVTATAKTVYITVKKGTTTVVAPKVVNKCGLGQYFNVTVSNTAKKAPISGLALTVKLYNGKKVAYTYSLKTNANGQASLNTKAIKQGTYNVVISSSNKYYTVSKSISSGIVMQKQKTIVSADKVSYLCGSSKSLKINVTKESGDAISGLALTVKVYSGNKLVKTYTAKTGSNGVASVNTKDLGKGTYKVVVSSSNQYYAVSKSANGLIEIYKYKTTVNAPKVTNKYKSSKYFKINVTGEDGLPISKLSLSVKVYTGKKYKTYTVTTNGEGIASLNTKALAKGTHKVVISSKNVAYDVSKSGNLIVIK